MEYNLNVNKQKTKLHADTHGGNKLSVVTEKNRFDVEYCPVSENRICLKIDNNGSKKQVVAYIADEADGKRVFINGVGYLIENIDPVKRKKAKKHGNLSEIITPPTPAVVIKIMVNAGDLVKKEQDVIVVSAMKMETTLVAPFDGKVTKINTSEGNRVMPGDVLVEIGKNQGNLKN